MEPKGLDVSKLRAAQPQRRDVPPWELDTAMPVPFMDATSEPLSASEREGLPELWAAHTQAATTARSKLGTSTPNAAPSMSPISAHEQLVSPWTTGQEATYESPYHKGPTMTTLVSGPVNQPASDYRHKPPLTPPDSASGDPTVKAIPGTMSSSGSTPQTPTYRTRSTNQRQNSADSATTLHSRNLSRRVKAALKDAFTRNPVDEGAYVHIGDAQHWTEE